MSAHQPLHRKHTVSSTIARCAVRAYQRRRACRPRGAFGLPSEGGAR